MKTQHQTLAGIAEEVLPQHDAYLIDVQTRGDRGETVVQILADTDTGITIDQCAKISKEIACRLEDEGLITTKYRLEVSSPGLAKPLKHRRQYRTHSGSRIRLRYGTTEGEEEVDGTLMGIEGTRVSVEREDGMILTVEFDSIRDCRHRLPW